MNIYLDNNVFVDIEMGSYSPESFLLKKGCVYHFSDAHLNELLEGLGNPKISQEGRLNLISQLCGSHFIVSGVLNAPEFLDRNPKDMYIISACSPIRLRINAMANSGDAVFMRIRSQLGFEGSWLNNVGADSVLKLLDERMKERLDIGLLDYLIRSEAIGGKPLYYTLINIIDTANYWADKKTTHSNVARLHDAAHAYSAQICDLLVTNDKRMRAKVNAVYAFLGVNTKVVSVNDFFEIAT